MVVARLKIEGFQSLDASFATPHVGSVTNNGWDTAYALALRVGWRILQVSKLMLQVYREKTIYLTNIQT